MSTRYSHLGAGSSHKLPYRLNPRRTARVLGWRVTPRTSEGWLAGLAGSVLLVGCSNLPDQFATWVSHLFG